MKNNNVKKEVYIAIGVALIMIIICLFVFLKSKNSVKQYTDIKVYKLFINDLEKKDYYYKECSIDTEAKLLISENYNKIERLNDSKMLTGVGITGNYKIVVDDDYFAFDNVENNYIYRGSQNKIYTYDTDLYKRVIDWCE